MNLLLVALTFIAAGGFGAFVTQTTPKLSNGFGLGGAITGSALGLLSAILFLTSPLPVESVRLPWSVPYGSFYIELDALSAFFLLPIFLLTGLSAVYGARYLWEPKNEKRLGSHWLFFCLLAVSMVMVAVSRNAILFLVAWEVMALSSFFLVTMDDEKESVQQAGWTYLVSTHLGTMVLFFFFILIGHKSGSLDFDHFAIAESNLYPHANLLFSLALIGFGSKAGMIPLHIWLPEAHPAAPSHVSALMSGVMIKTGIYGILRTLTWLGHPPVGWALTMIIIGSVSGVIGVLMALSQRDLKRVLAYSSVENIGIIFLGIGIGILGQATGTPAMTILGYGGALWHILNHSIFKGLLFFGAGSVLHGAKTLDLEQTGGLLKRMPWTGIPFLIGAVAISGLPPLNGFISEFMIFLGAFHGIQMLDALGAIPAILTIIALASIGGLSVACFTRTFGTLFLGHPRSSQASQAHEVKQAMRLPMVILATLCVVIGLSAPLTLVVVKPVLVSFTNDISTTGYLKLLSHVQPLLLRMLIITLLFAVIFATIYGLRKYFLSRKVASDSVTWDCGYVQPTSRMQYTASSFAQPITNLTSGVTRLQVHCKKPEGLFPTDGSFESESPDGIKEGFWSPVFKSTEWFLLRFRWIQMGSIHLYILYIAITLSALLIWKLR
ncbi:MAG: proton-conducting transporter membrane subunit [bacterium]|nr:proton-conducting transporter membrane subunit [bacterium]